MNARDVVNRGVRGVIDVAGPYLMGTITRVDTSEPLVALTFDDGPHPEHTPHLLDVLERHGARATFFVIGERAVACRDVLARQVAGGHVVGHHSWDHTAFPELPSGARRAQLRACERALAPFGSRLFRPPHGLQTVPSRMDLLACGYQVITWDLDVQDFKSQDAGWIAGQLEQRIRPGSIVLLHDANWNRPEAADRSATVRAVDTLLTRMRNRYRFVTVPELLRAGRPVRVNWFHPWYWN